MSLFAIYGVYGHFSGVVCGLSCRARSPAVGSEAVFWCDREDIPQARIATVPKGPLAVMVVVRLKLGGLGFDRGLLVLYSGGLSL